MIALAIILAIIPIIMDLAAIILLTFPELSEQSNSELPDVSILVPMLNEETNVEPFIRGLQQLDYPRDKVEILIGEDRSTDYTPVKLQQAAIQDPRIKVISIKKDLQNLVGKANVLAHLVPLCKSDYYFITDADVRIPPTWIKTMLAGFKTRDGIIGGTTVVPVTGLWSGLQNIDWLLAQGLLSTARKLVGTLAVSGTNMMVSREACESIGGYQNIPFSLTEDIGLLFAVKQKGYSGSNLLHPGCMAFTEVQEDLGSLLTQRGRWTFGVLKLPVHIVSLLFIRALFMFFVLAVSVFEPVIGCTLYLIKTLTDLILVKKITRYMRLDWTYWHILFFEIYWLVMSIGGAVSYLFSINDRWKGRKY